MRNESSIAFKLLIVILNVLGFLTNLRNKVNSFIQGKVA